MMYGGYLNSFLLVEWGIGIGSGIVDGKYIEMTLVAPAGWSYYSRKRWKAMLLWSKGCLEDM